MAAKRSCLVRLQTTSKLASLHRRQLQHCPITCTVQFSRVLHTDRLEVQQMLGYLQPSIPPSCEVSSSNTQ
eukprot:2669144-Amphidinium_carterae.1